MPIFQPINEKGISVQLESTSPRPRLTVGILTLNEEKRIASCIQSARFAVKRNRVLHYLRESIHCSLNKLVQLVQLGALKCAQAGKTGGGLGGLASGFAIFLRLCVFRRGFSRGAEGSLFCFLNALESFFLCAVIKHDPQGLNSPAQRS